MIRRRPPGHGYPKTHDAPPLSRAARPRWLERRAEEPPAR